MKSIRTKFFIQFGFVVVFIIGILFLANNFFLKPYYISAKENLMEEYYEEINQLDSTEFTYSTTLFRTIEFSSNFDILILDSEGVIAYSSRVAGLVPPPPLTLENDEQYELVIMNEPSAGGETLILQGDLDNGYHIQLKSPISGILENIRYVNDFLLYVGLIGFLLAMIISFLLANQFTKPIRKINTIAKQMKNLDFTHYLETKSKDELGELSESINNLASTLSLTFENLNQELEENKKLSEKRRELLNNVSHELKTPLALIQGYSEGLSLNINDSQEKTDYYLEVIMGEAKNMNRIIEDLLDIEDISTQYKINLKNEIDLNSFILNIANKYQMQIHKKDLKLVKSLTNDYLVTMDTYLTERVLTNFITNAIHYCDELGEIKISTKQIENKVRVSIYNTFKDYDEKSFTQVWESFYKVDQARTRDVGGHGLGLAIVKSIQTQLKESFGVSAKENGVEFWFEVTLS